MKLHNYVRTDNSVYYLLGDTLSPGSSFRVFTIGILSSGNINAIRIFATGMRSVLITNVFPSNNPIDLIVIYDSALQQMKAYVNGILNYHYSITSACFQLLAFPFRWIRWK
ncbi:hypothetical protein [Chryseobacterium sp. 3008163]|uniref:hypothetical protein n=1 Tax=Chryseobacterium sp. 3008163 TaxID=2478663 RepID=UPI001013CA18|nr:hypothetical protein [Chryseobacterium sp. 3008163]